MQWSPDGEKICIAYDDGNVIVGSVDGQRLWGSELSQQSIAQVKWSPDSSRIVFALGPGTVHVYDSEGNFMFKLNCLIKNEKIFQFAWFWDSLHFQEQLKISNKIVAGRNFPRLISNFFFESAKKKLVKEYYFASKFLS